MSNWDKHWTRGYNSRWLSHDTKWLPPEYKLKALLTWAKQPSFNLEKCRPTAALEFSVIMLQSLGVSKMAIQQCTQGFENIA
jgi:hypothetical protein